MESKIEIRPGRIVNIATYLNTKSNATAFLIHGLGGRGDQWREQIGLLKEKYSLIIPDLLGHGKSEKPKLGINNPYTFTEFELDLQAIFSKHASSKNIIIGHSYGGALATALAINHQDKLCELILISPTPCLTNIPIPFSYRLPIFILGLIRPWLEKQFERSAFSTSSDQKLIADEMRANKNNLIYVIKGTINGIQTIPHIEITRLTTPTLIILGEEDRLIPPRYSENFYQAIPHHQFVTLNKGSHMSPLEKPEEINLIIQNSLKANHC